MNIFEKVVNEIEFKEAKDKFISQLPMITEACSMMAMTQKIQFEALVEQGFQERQALYIVAVQNAQNMNGGNDNE